MLSFDLGKEEFENLVSGITQPCLIQLLARVDTGSPTCSPLDLYRPLRASGTPGYSYLLESVEKQAIKARYSFVGNDPDAVLKISDQKISIELLNPKASAFFEIIRSKIESSCGPETMRTENQGRDAAELNKEKFTASIPQGEDAFDALR